MEAVKKSTLVAVTFCRLTDMYSHFSKVKFFAEVFEFQHPDDTSPEYTQEDIDYACWKIRNELQCAGYRAISVLPTGYLLNGEANHFISTTTSLEAFINKGS